MLRRLLPPVLPLLLPAALIVPFLSGCGGDEPTASVTSTGAAAADSTQGVIDAVSDVAPALESAFRGGDYPQSLQDVEDRLPDTGVTLPAGISLGSYVYDADATEFTLCLQDQAGAWASYDTAPMGVRDSGTSGGCP